MAAAAHDAPPWLDMDSSRRSACDRCRSQKLRCERPANAPSTSQIAATCHRCRRVGAFCTTTIQPPRKRSRQCSPRPLTPSSTATGPVATLMMLPESPASTFPQTPSLTTPWDDVTALVNSTSKPDVWDSVPPTSWGMNNSAAIPNMDPYPTPPDFVRPFVNTSSFTEDSATQRPFSWEMNEPKQAETIITIPNVFQILDELAKLNHALVQETAQAKAVLSPVVMMAQSRLDQATGNSDVKSLILRTLQLSERFTIILNNVANPDQIITPVSYCQSPADQDQQVYPVVAIHLVSLYTTFTHLFRAIMVHVRDVLIESKAGYLDPLFHLPHLRIEGLGTLNDAYMHICMFIEACMHLVELAHNRVKQIHDRNILGLIASQTLGLVVGASAQSSQPKDCPDLPLSQKSIRALHHSILVRLHNGNFG